LPNLVGKSMVGPSEKTESGTSVGCETGVMWLEKTQVHWPCWKSAIRATYGTRKDRKGNDDTYLEVVL
jgi:hypothetical protein